MIVNEFLGTKNFQGLQLSDSEEELSSTEKHMFDLYGKDGLVSTQSF